MWEHSPHSVIAQGPSQSMFNLLRDGRDLVGCNHRVRLWLKCRFTLDQKEAFQNLPCHGKWFSRVGTCAGLTFSALETLPSGSWSFSLNVEVHDMDHHCHFFVPRIFTSANFMQMLPIKACLGSQVRFLIPHWKYKGNVRGLTRQVMGMGVHPKMIHYQQVYRSGGSFYF